MPYQPRLYRMLHYPLLGFLVAIHLSYFFLTPERMTPTLRDRVLLLGGYVVLSTTLRTTAWARRLPTWVLTLWVYADFAIWFGAYPPTLFGLSGSYTGLVLTADAATIGWRYKRGLPHMLPVALVLTFGPPLISGYGLSETTYDWVIITLPAALFFYLVVYMATRVLEEENRAGEALRQLGDAHRQLQEYAAEVETVAVLRERNRLAREVHDSIAHSFTSILMQAELLEKLQARSPEEAREVATYLKHQVRESLNEVRRAVHALRRAADDHQGVAALADLIHQFQLSKGMAVDLSIMGTPVELPAAHDLCLYRAVQEGLTNAFRHGHASSILVQVEYGADQVSLRLLDDGTGTTGEPMGGLGLVGTRERVSVLGGNMEAHNAPDGGFVLRVALPLAFREVES